MPTYDYKCKVCAHIFEMSHPMTTDLVVKCPECGKSTEKIITGGTGFIIHNPGGVVLDPGTYDKRD